jgi:hypothetical protein
MVNVLGFEYFITTDGDREKIDTICISLLSNGSYTAASRLRTAFGISDARWVPIIDQGFRKAYNDNKIYDYHIVHWRDIFVTEEDFENVLTEVITA